MNRALRRISLVVLAMFLLLLLSVNYVQAFEPSSLAVQRGNARVFSQQYQYQRGSILTSNNKTIAESVHVKGIYAYQRSYPDPLVYAPVTGYDSLYSATGIEKTEDKFLSGSDPQLTVHNLIDLVTGKPRRGATVQLTINSAAQTAAYNALKETGLPSGAVALDPKTGAVLALASYPTFNPNKYATFNSAQLKRTDNRYLNNPAQPLLNRAINQTFPPGSTFKVVTSSTAFSTGKYNPQTRVYAPTNLKLPGTTKELINFDNLPCDNGSNPTGNGKVPFIYAFTVSCNTVFGNLGMQLGDNAIRQQAVKFGMNDAMLPAVLYAACSDRLIATAAHAAGVQETPLWRSAGLALLYGLRAVVAFPSTAAGLRRCVLQVTPLPGKAAPAVAVRVPAAPFTDAESAAAQALALSIAGGNPHTPNALQTRFRLTRAETTRVVVAVTAASNGHPTE